VGRYDQAFILQTGHITGSVVDTTDYTSVNTVYFSCTTTVRNILHYK